MEVTFEIYEALYAILERPGMMEAVVKVWASDPAPLDNARVLEAGLDTHLEERDASHHTMIGGKEHFVPGLPYENAFPCPDLVALHYLVDVIERKQTTSQRPFKEEQTMRLNKRVEEQCTTLEEALSRCEINLIQNDSGGWQLRVYATAFPKGIGIGYGDEGHMEKEIEAYLNGVLDVLEAFS